MEDKTGGIMATAIICEFNPFHNGHRYIVNRAKELTNEPIIAIMSGSFTQRGEAAVTDKFTRTKTALENGADLVVELPVTYAVSNAQHFASGGVQIAKAFECVKNLAFGCEDNNLRVLRLASEAIYNAEVNGIIKAEMQKGSYYPKALEKAVNEIFGADVAEVLKSPNNILAVEYIRALKGSQIKPVPIARKGVEHNSCEICENIASASLIRKMLRDNQDVTGLLPSIPEEITFAERLESIVMYRLRTMSAEELAKLPEMGEGLENRIINAVKCCNSLSEIIMQVKTKRYTYSRLSRIMAYALLGITEDLQKKPINYVRVLGFNQEGAKMLRACRLPLITSVGKALRADNDFSEVLQAEIRSTDISALAYDTPKSVGRDFLQQIIKF